LLAVELLDELVGGTRAAAWPLIRRDLDLDYAQIGLVLAVPGLVGTALEPAIGILGDSGFRRRLIFAGGVAFAVSTALSSVAVGFWTLLAALIVGNPATTAFVSLGQATLMDSAPEERERNMARWTFAGSVGVVAGPGLVAAAVWIGAGWRPALGSLGLGAAAILVLLRRLSLDGLARTPTRSALRDAWAVLHNADVLRWLGLLAASDLMLDVLHGFVALYFVDVVHVRPVAAAAALAVWTGASLVGDFLLIGILRRFSGTRFSGTRYLRASAAAAAVVFPLFLLVEPAAAKLVLLACLGLVNSGWYAIPKARLYAALPGRSGTAVALSAVGAVPRALFPLALGFLAQGFGLGPTMWLLLAAPLALLAGVPRELPLERT
jgi:MFS transporter, FSR family, fosmidomycin resistance protein